MKISATVILPEDVSVACERAKYPVVSCHQMRSATNKKLHLLLMQVPDTVDLNSYAELFDGLTDQKSPLISAAQPEPTACPGVVTDTPTSSPDQVRSDPTTIGAETVERLPYETPIDLPPALRVNND